MTTPPDPTITLAPSGEHFLLTLPGGHATQSTHTISIPINIDGVYILDRIFRRRAQLTERALPALLGDTGNPIQHTIDAWLRQNSPTTSRNPEVKIDLKKLGLAP